jgi:hypothetical protein
MPTTLAGGIADMDALSEEAAPAEAASLLMLTERSYRRWLDGRRPMPDIAIRVL